MQSAGVAVIDVREPAEFAEGHLPGSFNIPRGVLEFQVDGHPAVAGKADPQQAHRRVPVILYCRTGGRSALAAEALKRLGFDRPLDPAWRIADPLSLRREPGDEALTLATNGDGELLSLPVEWSGDLLELSVDLTLAELEYGTSLDIELVPEGAPAWMNREQLLEKLTRALEMREEFISVASHELRTPLAGVIG